MTTIQNGELQLLARNILRANSVEMGDDPRTEVQVAVALGYLVLDAEFSDRANAQPVVTTEV